ncbi:MAG TPA: alanine racemase [Planctomycetota bacterium]|nr:alanine racemase [Planctomycetota bacterium]
MRAEDLQTPTLLIHLDRVRHNLATMQRLLGGAMQRWRPHVKTCKVPEVLAMLLDTGVRRFKCATTREAEVLLATAAAHGPIDVLFAMAQHGANLDRITALAAAHAQHRFALLTEDPQHAASLPARGLGAFVDLDPGYHRTGIPLGERARIAEVVRAAGRSLRGLHCYDGHLHGGTMAERTAAAHTIYREFTALARHLGVPGELVTSGTPTFPAALAFADFANFEHTISPGTVVYWDARSDTLGIDGFLCAVEVQARVVSRPVAVRFTLDAGSKALDAAAGDPCAELRGEWHATALTPSEEHLPMQVTTGSAPPHGAIVRLVPRHVCPTVNLAGDAVLLDGGRIVGIVPVRARGHETLPESSRP